MILRSIQVDGWRCFAAAVAVGPLGEGLNVIHGPNGIGKSTLMMALVRGLFDSHSVGGNDIKTLRPWGRSLNPKVTIEFDQDDTSYRLEKQFLTSPSSRLSRQENGRFVPLAESREADEQAREILAGEAPSRGVTDQRHWGLAQILWATQGSLQISELADGTRATIQDALGAQVAGPGAEVLERKIADSYGQFYTPTGKLKAGASAPAVVGLRSQWETAVEKHQKLLARLDEFDAASRRIEDLRGQTEQAQRSEHDLTARLKLAREQAQAYKELISQQKLHQHEATAAAESYRNWKERIDAIQTARGELDTANKQLTRLQDDAPAQAKLVQQCRQEAEQTKQAVAQIRARRAEVKTARQQAELAGRLARTQETLVTLEKQLAQVDAARDELAKLGQLRDRLVAPDKKTLDAVKKTARARDDARLKLDAALITVIVRPETGAPIEISTAEQPGPKTLISGETLEIKGAPEVVFRIPNVASFRATGPTGSVDELREQLEKSLGKLQELTVGFGTTDVDQLEKLHAQAAELAGQIERTKVKLETLLGGGSLEELRAEQARAASTREEILTAQPAWKENPADPDGLLQQADDVERQFTTDIDRAEAASDRAHEALNRALQKQSSHDNEIKGAERQIAAVDQRLKTLVSDGLDDAQRKAKLTEIALQQDIAQGKAAQVGAKLQEFGDDPSKSVAVLDGQLTAVRQEAVQADRNLSGEKGRLEQIIAEAPYTALAAVEEEISRLEDEIARQQLHIDAIRLLFETLTDRKRQVMQAVLGPVRLRANQTLQRIAGTRFDDIHFDQSLLPIGVAPRSLSEPVSLDQLSGGEREQLYFAVRLALADVAFAGQRQLVVLDDVFTYTDTTRLARIATILDEAADRFQIVLLTCHPERYRGLPNAKFFDLEAIASGDERRESVR